MPDMPYRLVVSVIAGLKSAEAEALVTMFYCQDCDPMDRAEAQCVYDELFTAIRQGRPWRGTYYNRVFFTKGMHLDGIYPPSES